MSTEVYRIVAGPFYTPTSLATAPTRGSVVDALADMGTGMVIAADGHIVAFHERHLATLTRLGRVS